MVVFPFRKLSPKTLLKLGLGSVLIGSIILMRLILLSPEQLLTGHGKLRQERTVIRRARLRTAWAPPTGLHPPASSLLRE